MSISIDRPGTQFCRATGDIGIPATPEVPPVGLSEPITPGIYRAKNDYRVVVPYVDRFYAIGYAIDRNGAQVCGCLKWRLNGIGDRTGNDLQSPKWDLITRVGDLPLSERERKALAALEFLEEQTLAFDDIPAANCSCHLSPPCGDCVDYGGIREALAAAKEAIALLEKGAQP